MPVDLISKPIHAPSEVQSSVDCCLKAKDAELFQVRQIIEVKILSKKVIAQEYSFFLFEIDSFLVETAIRTLRC